jgi:hypothetical protein
MTGYPRTWMRPTFSPLKMRTVAEVDEGRLPYGCRGCESQRVCPLSGCYRWEERRRGGRMA